MGRKRVGESEREREKERSIILMKQTKQPEEK